MDWIQLVVVIAVFGLAFWAVQTYLPVPNPFKGIILLIMCLAGCLYLLNAFGIGSGCGGTVGTHLRR